MNNPADDMIEQMLKADGRRYRDEYIDDAGFTQRVVIALPVPTCARVSRGLRWSLTYGLALVVAITVTIFAGVGNFMIDAFMDIATSTATTASIGFGLMFAVTSLAALFAMGQQK
jgi:hypothetical protein